MGFFSSDGNRNLWIERLAVDTGNWFHVFSACLGKMMAVQTACSDQVVKGQDWNVDFEEGSIRFGAQKYPLQFIGRVHGKQYMAMGLGEYQRLFRRNSPACRSHKRSR